MKYLFEKRIETIPVVLCGSSGKIINGSGTTKKSQGNCNPGWFAGESTIILGANSDDQNIPTCAEWYIPVHEPFLKETEGGYLVIACERYQGGLHPQKCGAIAKVFVNGNQRDIIGLKVIPPDHTDYFHRPEIPQLPSVWPLSSCGTIYCWPIHKHHLVIGQYQVVRIELDPQVGWDIDYIALFLQRHVKQLRTGVKETIFAILGAIIGAIATKFLGG